MGFVKLGSQNYSETVGVNESINLLTYRDLGDISPGQVTDSNPGIITAPPTNNGSAYEIVIVINNTQGSAPAFLETQEQVEDYDAANNAVVPWGALVVQAGQSDGFGPFPGRQFNYVLRQLVGAHCFVTVMVNNP